MTVWMCVGGTTRPQKKPHWIINHPKHQNSSGAGTSTCHSAAICTDSTTQELLYRNKTNKTKADLPSNKMLKFLACIRRVVRPLRVPKVPLSFHFKGLKTQLGPCEIKSAVRIRLQAPLHHFSKPTLGGPPRATVITVP